MKPIHQLLRQPMKTLSGIVLITLAVAILCVCVGQAAVAANMEANLEEICTSVALTTDKGLFSSRYNSLTKEIENIISFIRTDGLTQWLYQMETDYPEVVERINKPGLASAYIPELTPSNHTASFQFMQGYHPYTTAISIGTSNTNYSQAMLEITLTEIGTEFQPYEEDAYHHELDCVSVELTGTVESILGLQEGYADPTGFTARITLVLPEEEVLDAMHLEIGQRYLVYGMDYTDLDWELRNDIAISGYGLTGESLGLDNPQIDHFDTENLKIYSDHYLYQFRQAFDKGIDRTRGIRLSEYDMKKFRSVSFTILDLTVLMGGVSDRYTVPTIAKIDSSVDEFLAGTTGALWQTYLDNLQTNNQSFAVIGVDELMATGDFATQEATISSGRNFTSQEIGSGAKVCIISEDVALRSGLKVGDSITLNYYSIDAEYPYQNRICEGYGTANPSAYNYGPFTKFTGAGERYTIVGLYRNTFAWQGENSSYDFRVNTVFVPKGSVTGEMDYGETGIFLSVVVHNGKLDHFEALASRDGFDGFFTTTDQGYATVKSDLGNYDSIAAQALTIGAAVYVILITLFLLFYPAMQHMSLSVMAKLGASTKEMLVYMIATCLGILIPGTVAGMLLGAGFWDNVVSTLTESSWTNLELKLDWLTMILVAVAQLAFAGSLSFLVSLGMTLNNNLMNRQRFRITIPGLKQLPLATAGATLFAVIVALALCALNASGEAEYANYEVAVQEVEVPVSVISQDTADPYNLNAETYYIDLLYYERFNFSLVDYLTDLQYMTKAQCESINWEPYGKDLWGISSTAQPKELSPIMDAKVTWFDGFDVTCMDSTDAMYLLVPEDMSCIDQNEETPGTQLIVYFIGSREYGRYATVAGTYSNSIDSQTIYCSFGPLITCCEKARISVNLQYFSAVLAENDTIEELRTEANKCFIDSETGANGTIFRSRFIFFINQEPLERLAVTLKNSIRFNELCALLIFILAAGAGFILGFLMIRSRKREIILMRTLGRANWSIYVSYALEQMLCIVAGAALGGAVFHWQPLDRLIVFVGIYFVGLSAALILFLNSKLLTTIKEDE